MLPTVDAVAVLAVPAAAVLDGVGFQAWMAAMNKIADHAKPAMVTARTMPEAMREIKSRCSVTGLRHSGVRLGK